MDLAELETLYRFMRERGIAALEHAGTKLVLGAEPIGKLATAQSTVDARTAATAGRELTHDELLFASSLGWPEDQERRDPQ